MLRPIELNKQQAQKLALVCQGLHKANPFGAGIKGTLNTIERLSYVQIDSISVIQRAHHHCLWTRVNNYQPEFLDQLIEQKQIFEYWSHAAAYLPIQDYRYSLPKKYAIAAGEKHWREKNPAAEKKVLERIRQEGPLQAKDFAPVGSKKGSGWWDWKPDKVALEQLFIEGELMVVARKGFQKVYDLTERVLPAGIDIKRPSEDEYNWYLVTRYLEAHGLATIGQIGYLRKGLNTRIKQTCQQMLENNELQQIEVAGMTYFCLPNLEDLFKQSTRHSQLRILSPFDNLIIQRQRLAELFNFEYQIECYLPAAKRQYGYFCLPLLWGSEFVGRMDAKIERKTKVLHIQNLHLETVKHDEFIELFQPVLQAFMQFNGGNAIKLHKVSSNRQLDLSKQTELKQCLRL